MLLEDFAKRHCCLSRKQTEFKWFVSCVEETNVTWISSSQQLQHKGWEVHLIKRTTVGNPDEFRVTARLVCANEPHLKDRMKVRITFQVLAVTKPGKPVVYSNEGVKDDLDPSLENQGLLYSTFTLSDWKRNGCVRHDTALFCVKLSIEVPPSLSCAVEKRRKLFIDHYFIIENTNVLGSLLLEEKFQPDVVIVDEEGNEHSTHKLLLKHHSPVFKAMFSDHFQGLQENNDNKIKMDDISVEALNLLLKYMYEGTVALQALEEAEENVVLDLIYVAEKYQMKTFQELFYLQIPRLFQPSNAISLLKFMKTFNVWPEMIQEAEIYCKENLEQVVRETRHFTCP